MSNKWRLLYRIPWLLLHLLIVMPFTLLTFLLPDRFFSFGGRSGKEILFCWFAGGSCRIFGLKKVIDGVFPPGPILIAANHISWLDIQLLHSISPMGFVAKAEIDDWPIAGWLARVGDTVFHRRGSHDSASQVTSVMTQRLEAGRKVAIFAEGGILPGNGVKRFHARLFAAAIETGTAVQPVMLRYLRNGEVYHEITFLQDESFAANFVRLLSQPPCIAHVGILPAIGPEGKQRRELAGESEDAVKGAYSGPVLE